MPKRNDHFGIFVQDRPMLVCASVKPEEGPGRAEGVGGFALLVGSRVKIFQTSPLPTLLPSGARDCES